MPSAPTPRAPHVRRLRSTVDIDFALRCGSIAASPRSRLARKVCVCSHWRLPVQRAPNRTASSATPWPNRQRWNGLCVGGRVMWAAFTTGVLLAGVSLGHCGAMCGPLAAISCARRGRSGLWRYQLGRAFGYLGLGAVAGELGASVATLGAASWANWLFAAVSAAACIAAARRIWATPRLVTLRSSATRRRPSLFALVAQLLPQDPLPLGFMSSLLPCGLLASALLAAAAAHSAVAGASLMFGFVTTSGIALTTTGLAAARLAAAPPRLRQISACLLIVSAGLIMSRPLTAFVQQRIRPDIPTGPLCHSGIAAQGQ